MNEISRKKGRKKRKKISRKKESGKKRESLAKHPHVSGDRSMLWSSKKDGILQIFQIFIFFRFSLITLNCSFNLLTKI